MPTLVNEILLLIFEEVDHLPDRLNLLLLCRDWYDLLLPTAYTNISINSTQIAPLTCSIQRNPRLAEVIRTLHIGQWQKCDCAHHKPQQKDGGYHDSELFHETLARVRHPKIDLEEWQRDLEEGRQTAWFAVLLSLLKRLQSLDMRFELIRPRETPYVAGVLSLLAPRKSPFDGESVPLGQLETVKIHSNNAPGLYPNMKFLPFFHLPSIRTFHTSGMCSPTPDSVYERFAPVLKHRPNTSGVRDISIRDTYIGLGPIAKYITACTHLERFEYQHTPLHPLSFPVLQPDCFREALVMHLHTLQELRLNDRGSSSESTNQSWFGPLAEFSRLRQIHMPFRFLLDFGSPHGPTVALVDVLPVSLEYLCITHVQTEDLELLVRNIRTLISLCQTQFRMLSKLEIRPYSLELFPGEKEVRREPVNFGVPRSIRETLGPVKTMSADARIDFGFCINGKHEYLPAVAE